MIDFVDLHLHTSYSCLDAYGLPEQIVEKAKSLDRKAMAITDHGSVSGYVQFNKYCKNAGIKPIFGYEAYIVKSVSDMFGNKERKKYHITLLAQNLKGYQNILKLATIAYQKGFYYFPTIDWDMLFEHSEGIILLSGCYSSMFGSLLLQDQEKASLLAKKLKDTFGDRFYLETQHYLLFQNIYGKICDTAKKLDIPMVLTCDNHYIEKDQSQLQTILRSIRFRRPYNSDDQIFDAFQWDANELFALVEERFGSGNWENIFKNTIELASRCNVEIPRGEFPKYYMSNGSKPIDELIQLCKQGINKHHLKGAGEIYQKRFEREKKVIEEKGFVDYLLIAADLIHWAKENGILVGSGRGSAAGSLICYLLGITEIDPIKHDLLFERFIDETRTDPPDIDTDFDSDKRDLVKQYLAQKYGEDKVCDIATFARFKGKNSLDEIGKAFAVPPAEVSIVKKFLIDRSAQDMRSQITIQDTFDMSPQAKQVSENYPDILKACLLERQLRHLSVHAAGVLVSNHRLDDLIAVYERNKRKISSFEMKDISELGMLKIDLLGLTELAVISKIAEQVGMSSEDIYNIPLDDPETLKGFEQVDVEGVFQFEGDSTKSILGQMSKIDFEQLTACLSLSKPGPAHSGSTRDYIAIMNNKGQSTQRFDWHPILKEITKNSFGQIIYQEQIIKILRDLANFSVTDANRCRVVIAKRQGELEFDKYLPQFLEGTKGKISEAEAKKLWDSIKIFGRYCFNRSHAVSYAVLSFWSMYMKKHYPMDFYLVKLNTSDPEEIKARLLLDASRKGILIAPPKLGKSDMLWKKEAGNTLRSGLLSVKGIGEKTAEKLIHWKYRNRADFEIKKVKGVTIAALKALDKAKAFAEDESLDDFFGIKKYDHLDEIAPGRVKLDAIRNWEITSQSVKVAGTFVEMNYKDIFEEKQSRGQSTENIRNPEKSKFCMMLLEDETDRCLVRIDRFLFANIGEQAWNAYHDGNLVVVTGAKVDGWQMIRAKKVEVI